MFTMIRKRNKFPCKFLAIFSYRSFINLCTFIIALTAATVSTLLGTVAAIGIHDLRYGKRRAVNFVNNIPILNPDIITGISLFLLFISLGITQGYLTVILAHITFCTPYVVLSVMPRLTQMNPNISCVTVATWCITCCWICLQLSWADRCRYLPCKARQRLPSVRVRNQVKCCA